MFIVMMLSNIIVVYANVGLGGLISEKLISRSGVTGFSLIVSTATYSLPVVGFSGIVTTGTATDIQANTQTAVLHGTVTDMNGLPLVYGYFDWGYTAACGMSSSRTALTGTGNYQITLTDFDTTKTIYYRSALDGDGTSYGAVRTFTSGRSIGVTFIRIVLPLGIGMAIIIAALYFSQSPMGMFLGVLIGVLAFVIVQAMLAGL